MPGNSQALKAFRTQAARYWCKALRRRSQHHRLDWKRMNRLTLRWVPPARILRAYLTCIFLLDPRQEPSAVVRDAGICAGDDRNGGPYRNPVSVYTSGRTLRRATACSRVLG